MILNILPQPRSIRSSSGYFECAPSIPIYLPYQHDDALLEASKDLCIAITSALKCASHVVKHGIRLKKDKACIELELIKGKDKEAYRLHIGKNKITISASNYQGLYYGIQTLLQIITDKAPRLPRLVINDHPTYSDRGFYLDISRGKVPKLDTLKKLVKWLASFKVNQFQLYIEHVFDFSFDPDIGQLSDPLLPEEILELDALCRRYYIDFIPSLTCFGHMGGILSLPQYRKLAEIEWTSSSWKTANWRTRLTGVTLNPTLTKSKKLIEKMLDDYLPLFNSSWFNMCGDETYDLGKGSSANIAKRKGISGLYLDHLKFIRKTAASYGKRIMFWGDVMLHYPESIPDIPENCTVLDWGYSRFTNFKKTETFTNAGVRAYVCPSTRSYGTVFNSVENARDNITGYARAGVKTGAAGLLNTEWGDIGHFNMLPCSFHGMALGAAMAWNPSADSGKAFDRAFAVQVFTDRSARISRIFSKAGTPGLGQWPLLPAGYPTHTPINKQMKRKAESMRQHIPEWLDYTNTLQPTRFADLMDITQISLGLQALAINTEWICITSGTVTSKTKAIKHLITRIQTLKSEHDRAWLDQNKACGLDEINQRVIQKSLRRLKRALTQ